MRTVFRFAVLCVFTFMGCDENSTTNNSTKKSTTTPIAGTPANGSNSASESVTTSAPGAIPVAKFSITPRKGTRSTMFEFDASNSEGTINSYKWNFGDGTTANGRRTTHRFQEKGRFPVRLTVRNNSGSNSLTRNVRVKENGGGGGGGTKCQYTDPPRDVWFFKVIDNDPAAKTIIAEFRDPAGCDDVFYLCGDVRIGGIEPGEREYWIGTICEMWNLGSNRFRIHLVDGRYWVDNGETGTYVWPQYDCNPSVACDDFGY